jgi:hypothetical protein
MPICALADDRVLHFAERTVLSGPSETWLYDPRDDTFIEVAPPPWGSRYPCAIRTAEGWVAMIGGAVDGKPSHRCALYDPSTDTWHEMPAMPAPRVNHCLVRAGGRIYAISGDTGDGVARDNVWGWAPGEEWLELPDLPRAANRSGLAARGLADGSLVVWSTFKPCELVRWDRETWSSLGAVDEGVEVLRTSDGLLAIGGLRQESHADVNAWTPAGWTRSRALAATRCMASSVRLADGRAVILGGRRHAHYMRDTSTGGELDWEYRSFPMVRDYGLVDCEDLELETTTGWVRLGTPTSFRDSCVIRALRDGRLLVMQQYARGLDMRPVSYVWTPPTR